MKRTINSGGKLLISLHSIMMAVIVVHIILTVSFDNTGLSSLPLASLAIYLCLGMGILYALITRLIVVNWSYIAFILFTFVLYLSSLYSPTSQYIKDIYLTRFVYSFAIYFIVCITIKSKKDINTLLVSVIVSGVILSLLVYSKYGLANLLIMGERLDFGDINMLATYCSFSIVAAFAYFMSHKKSKFWTVLAMLICIPMVMFTGSRKSILLIAIGVVVFLFLFGEHKRLLRNIFIGATAIGLLIWLINTIPAFSNIREHFDDMYQLFAGGDNLDKGDLNRLKFIDEGLRMFVANPIFGNGFASSYYYLGTYTHCNFVELLMNNGIIGFGIYYYIRIRILYEGFKQTNRTDMLTVLCIVFSLMLLFTDVGVVSFYNRFLMIILAICVKTIDIKGEVIE